MESPVIEGLGELQHAAGAAGEQAPTIRGPDPSRPLPPHKALQVAAATRRDAQLGIDVRIPEGVNLTSAIQSLSISQPRVKTYQPTETPAQQQQQQQQQQPPQPSYASSSASTTAAQPSRSVINGDIPRSTPARSPSGTRTQSTRIVNNEMPRGGKGKGAPSNWQPSVSTSAPPAIPRGPKVQNPGFSRRGPTMVNNLDPTPPTALLTVTDLPSNIDSRHFRKKIGNAIKTHFTSPPRFKARLQLRRGVMECGLVLFPSAEEADKFFRAVTSHVPRFRPSNVEIGKNWLTFSKSDPARHRLTRQEVESLRFRPERALEDAPSDYEEEDEVKVEPLVHHCELGMWDDKGRFAPAWQSIVFNDHHSTLYIDADLGRLILRIDQQLISISLSRVERLIVDQDDFYIECSQLPMYLADENIESGNIAIHSRQIGAMPMNDGFPRIKFIRLDHLDANHAPVTPFCYVIKVRCRDEDELEAWLYRWQSKIADLVIILQPGRDMRNSILATHLKTLDDFYPTISFPLAFQVQKRMHAGYLLPIEVINLIPLICRINEHLTPWQAARLFEGSCTDLFHRQPGEDAPCSFERFSELLETSLERALSGSLPGLMGEIDQGIEIHSSTITPTSLTLDGAFLDEGNRIIRRYPGQEENFMRVTFGEEDGSRLWDSFVIDQDSRIFSERWHNFLTDGISIGGRLFKFLAFSTSSLKQHTAWFVTDFTNAVSGEQVSAASIRAGIGELESIRIPAKYAARMGQAFTTTNLAVEIDHDKIGALDDIARAWRNRVYDFSDGCGTLSAVALKRLHNRIGRKRRGGKKRVLPVVFQIRMAGAKGVLAYDSSLPANGPEVFIRDSMTKFKVKTAQGGKIALEVASTADRPLTFYLNRPLIALLETLGVPAKSMLKLQDRALATVRESVTSTAAAIRLLRISGYGSAPRAADLFQTLARVLDIDAVRVDYLKRCNMTCLTATLKNMKYRGRIQVDKAWTLMGVVDETGWLKEGEVYAQLRVGGDGGGIETTFLTGRCIIGRSPYLAPGDVQFAQLKGEPPEGSPLNDLYNCIVFSQHGHRPLSNQLAGGDLDGDLYNIIQNPALFPERTVQSAGYDPAKSTELDRPCTIEDVVKFFLTFIQTDRISAIADRHLCLSDRSPKGVEDPQCIQLAEMASIAVDYQKSGVAPDFRSMPRLPDDAKPDYMQSESRVEITPGSSERRKRWQLTYYQSNKALGQLFRRIEVTASIDQWGRSAPPSFPESHLRTKLWAKLRSHLPTGWDSPDLSYEGVQIASFYQKLQILADRYSPEHRTFSLTECEVFMGVILSRPAPRGAGGGNGRVYDTQMGLRDEFAEWIDAALGDQCGKRSVSEVGMQEDGFQMQSHGEGHGDGGDSWDSPIIDIASLRAATSLEAKEALARDARSVLVQLARWIKAAEHRQDSYGSGEGSGTMEAAKWVAIGPALRKCEELDLYELEMRRERNEREMEE